MREETGPMPLKAWKRDRVTPPTATGRPAMCGGPEYTAEQRLELMREKQRAMDEAARREREEAESRGSAGRRAARPVDGDDGYLAAERPRADRYAVTLLRQDDSAWNSGDAGSGVLG
ncbi:hypothetical protein O7606_03480 [Micromonospora sp. WMMD882]|uniref:hypothetical protein n=1 Tax=Micromonospora sp. WMMD882 TaxID=3015151 RepID=UPI00248CC9AA|nr:hypothetical protein [Micromonospora sp. WMMD882]WBB80457.1 hypothetical protein O7606_03480 [Micromonospora sp. WMMD882]